MAKRGRPKVSSIRVRPILRKGRGFVLSWRDPLRGSKHQKQIATLNRREADRLAIELEQQLKQSHGHLAGSWQGLVEAAEQIYRPNVKPNTWKEYYATITLWERLAGEFHDLDAINQSHVRRFQSLIPGGPSTKSKHLRQLKALFNFAKSQGLMPNPPRIDVPSPRQGFAGKGEPRTDQEIQALFDALDEFFGPINADSWIFALRGMLYSGLRVSEMMALSWDSEPVRLRVVKVLGVEVVTIYLTRQKSGKIEEAPTTRDFAELVLSIPPAQRRGFVFNLHSQRRSRIVDSTTVSNTLRDITKAAGITFTSHDLDRTFADRLSRTKTQQTLSKFTRRTPRVLEKYYAKLDSQRLSYEEMTANRVAVNSP